MPDPTPFVREGGFQATRKQPVYATELLGRCCFKMLLGFCLPVPQPTVVIDTNYSGLINAGKNFTFSDPTVVDVEILLALNWSRDDVLIASNDRISVSSVSTSESGYTASLTYSPIATSDSGLIIANVTVSPSDDSMYIQSVTATAVHNLSVHGLTTFMSLGGILPY